MTAKIKNMLVMKIMKTRMMIMEIRMIKKNTIIKIKKRMMIMKLNKNNLMNIMNNNEFDQVK